MTVDDGSKDLVFDFQWKTVNDVSKVVFDFQWKTVDDVSKD